jgi:CRP-like cAMP-binding protein
METLKKLLSDECDYTMPDQTMDSFMGLMTELHLKDKEPLIEYGTFDGNIYVVKSGIIRFAYFAESRENTFAFATPGTLMINYNSYYMNQPSSFRLESCGRSVVMKVQKSDFDSLLRRSSEFTYWMLRQTMEQQWWLERKSTVVAGTAVERFEALMKNRPEIVQKVSSKDIASYIGITPQSLSRIKRQFHAKNPKG